MAQSRNGQKTKYHMTPHDLRKLQARFPLSKSTIARNSADDSAPRPEPEQVVCNEPVGEAAGKAEDAKSVSRRTVRITSYRMRLLDPDNLAGGCKYFLDCCKYSQLISNDREQDIELQVRQQRVRCKNQERTEIHIIYDENKI